MRSCVTTIRIDGRDVQAADGTTLLQAARKLGINIPTLCSLDGSEPFTSCMLCVVEETAGGKLLPSCSAPAVEGMDVKTDSESVRAARRAALELLLAEHVGDCEAPCTLVCPLGSDGPEALRRFEAGKIREALAKIRSATAFPGLVCRLCPAPCEAACRRGKHDQAVSIRRLLQHIAEADFRDSDPALSAASESKGQSVAVIGAGAAGLSAAYHLALKGYPCRLFEAEDTPGGALRGTASVDPSAGRNAGELVERELDIYHKLGVRFESNTPVAVAGNLEEIVDSHEAVIVAAGPEIRPLLEAASIGIPQGTAAARGASRYQSSAVKVFAAGSLLEPGCSPVQALAQGKAAAACADQYLRGRAVTGPRRRFQSHIGRLLEGEISEFLEGAADIPRVVPSGAGYTREEAAAETSRCLQCDCGAKESCRLRDYAEEYEARGRRFRIGDRRRFRRIRQHPRITYEPGKCIKCGICVRITARENEQLGLAFLNRGYDLQIGAPFGQLLSRALEHSAERCVRSCPTGALYFRRRRRKEA